MRGKHLAYGEEVARWVWNRVGVRTSEYAAIGLKGERITAGVVFTRYSPGAGIELTIAGAGAWAVPEFFRAVFRYTFVQLDCKRATAIVASKNIRSRRLCERLGFVQEGVLKYGFKDDDSVIYGMYKENCRWIQ